jgi:predicted Zn-dependent protease
MYLGQKRFVEAQNIAAQIQSDYPETAWGPIMKARSLLVMQDFAGTRSILEELSLQFPRELMIWLILGNALLAEGKDLERAEQVLQKIIDLDPANTTAKRNLAALRERRTQQFAQGHDKATAVLSGA